MTCLLYREPELVVASGRSVLFVNPNDIQIFKEIILPEDPGNCNDVKITKASANEFTDGDDESDAGGADGSASSRTSSGSPKKKKASKIVLPIICNVAFSHNRLMLAITTTGQKTLLWYSLQPVSAKLEAVNYLSRVSSALTFSVDDKLLLLTDKTGECILYECADIKREPIVPKRLFAHLSIVCDVLWTPDTKYIITCDRDEKIRVTHYPETHEVYTYCLGHRDFVASICWLNEETLLSVSGDQTMRLWNYQRGTEVGNFEILGAGIKVCARTIDHSNYEVAALCWCSDDVTSVIIMRLACETTEQNVTVWRCLETMIREPYILGCDLCFIEDRLYLIGVNNKQLTITTVITSTGDGHSAEPSNTWFMMINEHFKDEECRPNDNSILFKKAYNNMEEYIERKRKRLKK